MNTPTYSRVGDGASGLLAEVDGDRLVSLHPDPTDPVSAGKVAAVDHASVDALTHPSRITTPLRRVGDGWEPASWDQAIQAIGEQLRTVRGRTGPAGVGLYLGSSVQRSSRDLATSLAFGVAMGTPHIFSELSLGLGPRQLAAELMLGHPAVLNSDLGRAHQIVVFGGDQPELDWGPGNYGLGHEAWIEHSRKTKGTKVVVVGPRKTPFAERMNQYLAIRPGTEVFFLLGMLSAAVAGDWRDKQYVDDYTAGWDDLVEAIRPWTVERCAGICGVDAATLSGVALKFSRAAMAVVHPDRSTFSGPHAGVAAWAWMALHTITANTLRPGALYEHIAPVDLNLLLSGVPRAGAPRTRATDTPLLLLQAPADCLADEIKVPGEGQVRALVVVDADPSGLAGGPRVRDALGELDLLVCLAHCHSDTTAQADWVLPLTYGWEQDDIQLLDAASLPRHLLRATPAVVPPAGSCRRTASVLTALYQAARPGLRGSAFGAHVAVAARSLLQADLAGWERWLVDFAADEGADALATPPFRIDRGDADRSTWRLSTTDGRIHLLPDEARAALALVTPPTTEPDRPLWLRTSARVDAAPDPLHRTAADPGLRLHPDAISSAGLSEGGRVRVSTRYGATETHVVADPTLRPDSADLPAGYAADTAALLSSQLRDPLSGVAVRDGLPCSVEPA